MWSQLINDLTFCISPSYNPKKLPEEQMTIKKASIKLEAIAQNYITLTGFTIGLPDD
ncbi:hypothetical protein DCCM_2954 [Desulfocucumis palustris]|uniref:Uncharacterized protein n=1 Tax=Desulfocucumis palustris TaxID=1898651 RepID=A0A2L2XDP4_9FIRM|nr:hypothetical protein DCCM_2954 [Desulfocucumis palustris]